METKVTPSEDSQLINRDEVAPEKNDERYVSPCCKFPSAVFFIIVNEFCERFYYYGMRAVLTLYLVRQISMGASDAAAVYHAWVALCYFFPLLGGILADSYFGKYKVILWFSVLYMIGAIILSVSAIPKPNLAGPIIGLFLIALGCGGIKACTSSFGGDQFPPDKLREGGPRMLKLQESYFSIFYFTINAGSVLSTFLTPIFREMSCLGRESCFSLAFGFPAILMLIAILVFISGKSRYIIVPPSESVVAKSFKCCTHGLRMYIKDRKEIHKKSWIDYANDKYDQTFINDIKVVGRILLLFIPILVFWALFDQQGSFWVIQGAQMNGRISEKLHILPDQMVAINPILILAFIPLYESFFYPVVEFLRIPNKPLRRMTVGMVLAGTAFLMSYFVQISIESHLPKAPPAGQAQLSVVSLTKGCGLEAKYGDSNLVVYSGFAKSNSILFPAGKALDFTVSLKCPGKTDVVTTTPVTLAQQNKFVLYGWQEGAKLNISLVKSPLHKDKKGNALVRAIYRPSGNIPNGIGVVQDGLQANRAYHYLVPTKAEGLVVTQTIAVKPGIANFFLTNGSSSIGKREFQSGEVVTILPHALAGGRWIFGRIEDIGPNSLHILWQIPQYVVITSAEILVSVTGLAFSYTQAPQSMKSTVSALWLFTVGLGDIIVVIVAEIEREQKMSSTILVFAIGAYITSVLFAIDAYFYIPNDSLRKTEEIESPNPEKDQ